MERAVETPMLHNMSEYLAIKDLTDTSWASFRAPSKIDLHFGRPDLG